MVRKYSIKKLYKPTRNIKRLPKVPRFMLKRDKRLYPHMLVPNVYRHFGHCRGELLLYAASVWDV